MAGPHATKARSAVGSTLVFSYAILLVGGLSGVLAARLLGSEGRGELAAIQLWPTTLGVVASLGLPEALVYFAARDRTISGRLVVTGTVMGLAGSLVAACVGWVLLPVLMHSQPAEIVAAARTYLVVTVFFAAGISFHVLRARDRLRSWNLFRVLPGLSWLGILVWAHATSSADPVFLSRCLIVSSIALSVPFVAWTVWQVAPPLRFDASLVRPLARYGLPGAASGLPQLLNLRLDQLLMVAFVSTEGLGLYIVAVSWASLALPLSQAVGVVLLPRLAGEPLAVQSQTLARGVRLTAAATTMVVVPLLVATPVVVPLLFGQGFEGAIVAAGILLLAAIALGVASVLQEGARGIGRPALVLKSEVAGVVATGASLPALLHFFGIAGAATASLFGYSTIALTLGLSRPIRTVIGSSRRLLPRRSDFAEVVRLALGRVRVRRAP